MTDRFDQAPPEDDQDLPLEDAPGDDQREDAKRARGAAGWGISILIHVVLALVFGAVVFLSRQADVELPPMRVNTLEVPPKKETPKQRELENAVEINVTADADTPNPVNNVQVPVEDVTQREEETDNPTPKGREEAVANAEMGSTGAFMAIGAGGGSSGMFGSRSGGGRRRAVGRFGGSKASESAVDAALRWFMRHQGADGSWDVETYERNCTEPGQKCEPGRYERGPTSRAGITGLVVLCYLGAGYDHQVPSRYKATVKKGLDWLLTSQVADGSYMAGAFNYEQSIACMAVAESFAMTNDPACHASAVKGWNVLMQRRFSGTVENEKVWGWGDYATPDAGQSIKTSATSWAIQCVKSLRASGIDVGDVLDGLRSYLRHAWESTCKLDNLNPKALDPYKDMTSMAYKYNPDEGATDYTKDGNLHNLPGCALVSSLFIGLTGADTQEATLANYIMAKQVPTAWPTNLYYLYYNTFGIFQMGGDRWVTWNGKVRDFLIEHQRREPACYDGSWDEGTNFAHDHGRLLSTSLACLSLEVYYRYALVHGGKAEQEQFKKTQRTPDGH